jgi:hypothetical protein
MDPGRRWHSHERLGTGFNPEQVNNRIVQRFNLPISRTRTRNLLRSRSLLRTRLRTCRVRSIRLRLCFRLRNDTREQSLKLASEIATSGVVTSEVVTSEVAVL